MHRIMHRLIRPKSFTIVSEDCWGGAAYQFTGFRYDSPFVGLWVSCPDYLDLLCDFKTAINSRIVWEDDAEFSYPVGRLGSVRIGFKHYASRGEAMTSWLNRATRISDTHLCYKIDFRHPYYTSKDIHRWNTAAFPNSVAFVNEEVMRNYGEPIHNAVCLNGEHKYEVTRYESFKSFTFWRWINEGIVVKQGLADRMLSRLCLCLYY